MYYGTPLEADGPDYGRAMSIGQTAALGSVRAVQLAVRALGILIADPALRALAPTGNMDPGTVTAVNRALRASTTASAFLRSGNLSAAQIITMSPMIVMTLGNEYKRRRAAGQKPQPRRIIRAMSVKRTAPSRTPMRATAPTARSVAPVPPPPKMTFTPVVMQPVVKQPVAQVAPTYVPPSYVPPPAQQASWVKPTPGPAPGSQPPYLPGPARQQEDQGVTYQPEEAPQEQPAADDMAPADEQAPAEQEAAPAEGEGEGETAGFGQSNILSTSGKVGVTVLLVGVASVAGLGLLLALRGRQDNEEFGGYAPVQWVVQGKYPGQHGWEDVTVEEDRKQGLQRLREYDENEPYPHRLVRRRPKKEG